MDDQTQYEAPEDEAPEQIEDLAAALLLKRDEAIAARSASGVERRWREDQELFDGLDEATGSRMIDYATGDAYLGRDDGPIRSRVVINIIRGKCETAEGRFAEIMFPTGDSNWGLAVTPVPTLVKALKDDRPATMVDPASGQSQPLEMEGKPVLASDVARAKMDKAEEAMKGMEEEIWDQLVECSYDGECRRAIKDAIRLGTGILKGPQVVKRIRKAWVPQSDGQVTVHALEMVEEHSPSTVRVDPWCVYLAPGCEDVRKSSYVWERDEILPRDLKRLIGVEGYNTEQIYKVLKEEPKRTTVAERDSKQAAVRRIYGKSGEYYEKWEYHGELTKDDLLALGGEVDDIDEMSVSACVVFVNDRPIKAQLHVLDTGDTIYDFFNWTEVAGSPWGIGIPRAAMWQARVITAAWRAMMDNGRDSSGANVVIMPGLEPADGVWELTGKKIWRYTGDENTDVRQLFAQFQLENNQTPLQNIIELALRFFDMETQLPSLFQGEQKAMPETLGATNIVVDSNNVALRTRVKCWDDHITIPHIKRYYDWNMQYNENPEIKGDFSVDARGASVLLERDQKAQAIINLWKLKGDPSVDAEINWGKAVVQLFQALKIDALKSDDEKKRDQENQEKNQPPQDPRIMAAQIRAQTDIQKAQLNQQADAQELQLKGQITQGEMEFKAFEMQQDRQHQMQLARLQHEMKLMEFSMKSGLELDRIKADLSKEASKQGLMREMAATKAQAPQMTEPPVEPPGKALEGQAFQK